MIASVFLSAMNFYLEARNTADDNTGRKWVQSVCLTPVQGDIAFAQGATAGSSHAVRRAHASCSVDPSSVTATAFGHGDTSTLKCCHSKLTIMMTRHIWHVIAVTSVGIMLGLS